ncbi:MAG: VF530 family protein [Imperialibacter sp.]|uniref:VF530 family protein n=1 Tax=Imperialibacter sp. TaxID=2038411 RepID=UPI0032ECA9B0
MTNEDPGKSGLAGRISKLANSEQRNNPLHGVRLDAILEELVAKLGWEELGKKINIRCFNYDPSIKSSLAFLRKTPWAREKVEQLYLRVIKK